MLCEYGCGQEATHQFRNGKWCCLNHVNKCPYVKKKYIGKNLSIETKNKISKIHKGKIVNEEIKKKMSESHKGKIVSEETKKRMSKSHKGRIVKESTRIKIGNAHKGKIVSKKTKNKMSESRKGKIPWNKGHKLNIQYYIDNYPLFSKIEEMRYNPDKPGEKEIQVHCKNHNCSNSKEQNGWFTPTENQLDGRRRALEDKNGNGGHYFYCCDECKEECPLYAKKVSQLIKEDQIKAGIIKKEYYTQSEYNILRTEVLERAEYLCEYCKKEAIDVHHIKPQKLEPFFALDPDYGIACCKECHYKYGHKDECSTGKLANEQC